MIPPAREVAEEALRGGPAAVCGTLGGKKLHGLTCDRLTAAIEQRDREVRTEALEAAAKVADEWANADTGWSTKMTARSIAGRIRSLPITETPGEGKK